MLIATALIGACSSSGTPKRAALLPPCRITTTPPSRYQSVVVFAFENRTWNMAGTQNVGGVGFGTGMPYLHGLAVGCSYFTTWTDTDSRQLTLTQYVGQATGARQPNAVNDCFPSATCNTTADNIFRQARRAGKTAIAYIAGGPCGGGAPPYLWGADDHKFCATQARPISEFDPNRLPNFAWITPDRCNNGHDCANAIVDAWAKAHVQPVLNSTAYRAGKVAVFIWYDEANPVPNAWITPSAHRGALTTIGAGYAGTLKAWEAMLGLPCLANACTAPSLRAAANS